MKLVQFRTDGALDITDLRLDNVAASKLTALELVACPSASGVYRVQFVDAEYDRVAWDSYAAAEAPRLGALAFAGAS